MQDAFFNGSDLFLGMVGNFFQGKQLSSTGTTPQPYLFDPKWLQLGGNGCR